jgi:hypothetical protein
MNAAALLPNTFLVYIAIAIAIVICCSFATGFVLLTRLGFLFVILVLSSRLFRVVNIQAFMTFLVLALIQALLLLLLLL